MLQILQHYVLGVMVPVVIYCYLKRAAHDSGNYYNVVLTAQPGSPTYNNTNLYTMSDSIKQMQLRNTKDQLGRSKFPFN